MAIVKSVPAEYDPSSRHHIQLSVSRELPVNVSDQNGTVHEYRQQAPFLLGAGLLWISSSPKCQYSTNKAAEFSKYW